MQLSNDNNADDVATADADDEWRVASADDGGDNADDEDDDEDDEWVTIWLSHCIFDDRLDSGQNQGTDDMGKRFERNRTVGIKPFLIR